GDGCGQLAGERVIELRRFLDAVDEIGLLVDQRLMQRCFERTNRFDREVVEEAFGAGEDRRRLQTDAHRRVLSLLQDLDEKTSPGYASRPGGRRSSSEISRYDCACLERSS